SVRRAAEATPQVDVLVNNAGRITMRRLETEDGFECLLGTNALGPFAYTNLVAHKVADRVVIVGSGAHRGGLLDLDDPHFTRRRWTAGAAYAQSKLADMVWGLGLSRRLEADVQLCHPGWSATGISNATGSRRLDRVVTGANRLLGQSAA
ncbi:MAG TPA: SDR family NAD(P)-dependent oxidoreductase, partial [Propionibacteriaceae bacterium]|nr:SDR family NAD(P)-dependent oxidoreductase [Propionibacteriaceae bacterium]